ncbi:unnamed protein product [Closterium sp. NIES-64]|nr:unnamed protein product [Closterium sp. NIES-64]
MYAVTGSDEDDCYRCFPPDPGIGTAASGTSEAAALGASASVLSGTGESALSGTGSASASHTFTLDSGASRSFFRDRTTLTPLSRPVAVSLADPSGGPVLSRFSTVLPCPTAPSGTLTGLYLPSFSTNLVSGADLQDAGVHQFTPARQRVTHCTEADTGRHLATFTRRPGSSLYTLTTASPPGTASGRAPSSGQVFAAASRSGPESAPCSCCRLSHETLLWHHRLGHPSLLRLGGMASRVLVSGLPRSLPPLPPGPGPACVPCVEGRQRAAPHSSQFPPSEAPLQTLHMDVWGPARVRGQGQERYFLLVVDDYSRYTTVFPLRSKGEVTQVLIDWIRAARLQLRRSFGSDFPVLRLHSDRGGEFSSALLSAYCRVRGIRQTFTLPDSPQQNGIAERRIGMVMDVARTSMMHAAAPHFLWPFAVRYAAHQINLHPRVSRAETSPALLWTGKVGDASAFRVWGSRAFVRDLSADKLSPRASPCVFLGFPPDAPGWQFYHPTSRRVLSSQDVTFDESVPYYRLFPYRTPSLPPPPLFLVPGPPPVVPLPPQGPAPSGVSQVDAVESVEVTGDSGAAAGAEPGGAESRGAEPGGAESGGAGPGGAEPGGAEPGGAEPGVLCLGVLCLGVLSLGVLSLGVLSLEVPSLEVLCLGVLRLAGSRSLHWSCVSGLPGAGGVPLVLVVLWLRRALLPRDLAVLVLWVLELLGLRVLLELVLLRTLALSLRLVVRLTVLLVLLLEVLELLVVLLEVLLEWVLRPELLVLFLLFLASPRGLDRTSALLSVVSLRLVLRRLFVLSALVVAGRVSVLTPVPGTHRTCHCVRPLLSACPFAFSSCFLSSCSCRPGVGLSSCCQSYCHASPCYFCCPDPSFESSAASALVTELVDFAARCRLDYLLVLSAESESACPPSVGGECALGTDVLEDRQEEFQCLASASPRLASVLLAPEGDPDALDIHSAFLRGGRRGVKRPPGSPPVFKARYVARGFSQRQGVDYFQTFSPTPKMTTLRVLLHIAAQRDYELHSLDFSTAFLQCSLHEEIWLAPSAWLHWDFPSWHPVEPPTASLTGLRQAPREWHDTLRTTLAALGFAPSTADPSLFLRTDTSLPPFYILVYVDDLVFATADTAGLAYVKSELLKRHTAHGCSEEGIALPVQYVGHGASAWRAEVQWSLLGTQDASWADDQATQRSSQGLHLQPWFRLCLVASTRSSSGLGSSCEAEIYAGAMAAQEASLAHLPAD